ncbi:hypothetical protein K503DRAFT_776254 [Rhizopogon vinicolor AM-OR11-026]|uniref:Uncharacterized protein n=1 Tax=Rhizopogon vinicolor AM-OR11-026 TaxID=1314800 RepID=A0A1B7MJR8_9AGAM|nr:hypothetical protein K503DRAFT_776254 [Rhizopogon vinicolor AM-OR11-026]
MTSFRTSTRLDHTRTQLQVGLSSPSLSLLPSQSSLTNSTAIASQSLSARYGRMNNLNVTVRHSTSATVPPTPTIIVTEPMTHSLTSETAEERIHKDLEHDRKDAER